VLPPQTCASTSRTSRRASRGSPGRSSPTPSRRGSGAPASDASHFRPFPDGRARARSPARRTAGSHPGTPFLVNNVRFLRPSRMALRRDAPWRKPRARTGNPRTRCSSDVDVPGTSRRSFCSSTATVRHCGAGSDGDCRQSSTARWRSVRLLRRGHPLRRGRFPGYDVRERRRGLDEHGPDGTDPLDRAPLGRQDRPGRHGDDRGRGRPGAAPPLPVHLAGSVPVEDPAGGFASRALPQPSSLPTPWVAGHGPARVIAAG
jgi:hypothetical protein